mmetsp:Transcript_11267/g.24836  ORF Transcript_11267/g.24836 Transcript_11267/m.24836 type:complete len:165 (+) Transcript_11267:3-497(+)
MQESHRGMELAFSVLKVPLEAHEATGRPATSLLRLRARLVPSRSEGGREGGRITAVQESLDPDAHNDSHRLLAGGDTNPGLLAKDLAGELLENRYASVGGMGAQATSRAVKSVVMARNILKKKLQRHQELLAIARTELVLSKDQEDKWRTVLDCFIWDDNMDVL